MENNEEFRILSEEELKDLLSKKLLAVNENGKVIVINKEEPSPIQKDELDSADEELERIKRKGSEYLATHKPKLNESEFAILQACDSIDVKSFLKKEFAEHPLSYYDNTDAYTSYLDGNNVVI